MGVPRGFKPNPSLAGLSHDHPPAWLLFEREILTWWATVRDDLLTEETAVEMNSNDSPLLHYEKEVLTWWHHERENWV